MTTYHNGHQVKPLGTFPHPVTGKTMTVIQYSNGTTATVKDSSLIDMTANEERAEQLKAYINAEYAGINATIDGNDGEDLAVMFENELPSGKQEIVTIYVTTKGYEVETCDTDYNQMNIRKIAKLQTLTKWINKRVG